VRGLLIKKELAAIPLLSFPKIPQKERRRCNFAASAKICALPKSGNILIVDIFDAKNRLFQLRFFSDGATYLVCSSYPAEKWLKRNPKNILGYADVASTKKDDELTGEFLKAGKSSWRYSHTLGSHLDAFACTVYAKKQRQAEERKYELMKTHFDMFPEYPEDLTSYCENRVFEHTYIFIDKISNGYRKAVCGHCQRNFKLKKDKANPGSFGVCPKCGFNGKYRGTWIDKLIEDKAKICIAHRLSGQLLLRWVYVQRIFNGTKYKYQFYDYFYNLYLHTLRGDTIYSYVYMMVMYRGWDWYRKKNGTVNYEWAHIYTQNLREVFGDSYYHVDLEAGLQNAQKISFTGLLDNLKNIPVAEYLFKSGLSALAANIYAEDLCEGNGFFQVLGVSKQYLPLYRKFNVGLYEHKIIKASTTWVSMESFAKFRELKAEIGDTADIINLLEQMSFERFVNYFSKQKMVCKRKMKFLLTQYKDYISMAQGLKADLSRKSVRFPQNIKKSHDLILERFNKVKHEIEDANFRQATEKLYAGMSEFKKGSFCVIFPQLRSDFITEGQSLNHCVGADTYYKNHLEGIRMIFFIRHITEPTKSFVTMEIDMRELRIRQLYGFGGCSPPTEVRSFANEFLRGLQPTT